MRVGIDIDNVVLEWQYHWPDLYRRWYADDRFVDTPALLDEWDACLEHTRFSGMVQFYDWYTAAGGWDTAPYVPGAPGTLTDLRRNGIEFVFVTSRPHQGRQSAHHLANKWQTTVRFMPNEEKFLAPVDVWIDDAPDVLKSLTHHGCRAIRFERPWNRKLGRRAETALAGSGTWPAMLELIGAAR